MEYLMTYGWAILIIAIVLGVLYYLGVFTQVGSLGTSCIASAGYLCQNPSMASNGVLSFTLGQSTGAAQYNIGLACASTANSAGLPYLGTYSGNAFYYPNSAGVAASTVYLSANAISLVSGQSQPITNLPCIGSVGGAAVSGLFNPGAIGATFTGSIWYNYTSTSGAASASNPWLTVKMATITIKTV